MKTLLIGAAGALILAVLSSLAGWYVRGLKADSDSLLIERAATAAANASGDKVIGAIGSLRPRYVTITNEVTRAADAEPRYRDPGCFHSDAVWLQLSAAYEAIGGPPLDRAGLPPAASPGGSQPAADHPGAH